ncbi:conserved Plasmodium protein, unknown function [Plasmodium ovale]|uniref:Uncharacterized protein n=1 Tax=Plasmodium ovale TaxID=36330 RepID=A0A1C3KXR0_PLAOA|nr:conserved Plasmodium protein, unknown function [Plasmodium ovale]
MSAAAIGVENRCLMKSKESNNTSSDCKNVDINYIIKDIYGFKNGRKRNVHFINDDALSSSKELKRIIKKIKIQDNCFNNIDIEHKNEGLENDGKQEEHSMILHEHNSSGGNVNDDIHDSGSDGGGNHDCSSDGGNPDCVNDDIPDCRNDGSHDANSNRRNHSNMDECTRNRYNFNENSNVEKTSEYSITQCNGEYTQTTIPVLQNEDNRKFLCKKFEMCIDNILESICSCSEIEEAKRIMIPLLSEFIQTNFICIDDYEHNFKINKVNNDTLQKEKKVLISAVKTQYQKIIQLQKIIDSQKVELKKKKDELNQIKAKVHQYFYDINNPNKRVFSILTPDVY